MGLPSLKSAVGAFSTPAASLVGWGFMGALSVGSYRQRVQQGQHPMAAAAKEGASFALGALLSTPASVMFYMGAPLLRTGTTALIGAVNNQTNYVRQMRTPFSHRFEHTEVTARAQQMGLQAIGSAWAHSHMGSEAAAFARRYAR